MEAKLPPALGRRPDGQRAGAVIRRCVHCGFCNATCPTFQVLGNELDGPRGRIYLMKRAMEGETVSRETQIHLDRCLTCQACESTCPSGVSYHELLDIGRAYVDARVRRPLAERAQRFALRTLLGSQTLLRPALRLANAARALLPGGLRRHLPRIGQNRPWPERRHRRRMIALNGCVQPALSPEIDRAAARLLDAVGITLRPAPQGCCGAMRFHLGDQSGGLASARARIRDWTNGLEAGDEAIVITASGCAAFVKDYARLFADDPELAPAAERVSAATRDVSAVLMEEGLPPLGPADESQTVALHCPCTLRHALGQADTLRSLLEQAGVPLAPVSETTSCCGSAGAYSLLQPALARRVRKLRLAGLEAAHPTTIATANIGCLHHLAAGTERPVRHWLEMLAERLPEADSERRR